jgi:hypothetical protein
MLPAASAPRLTSAFGREKQDLNPNSRDAPQHRHRMFVALNLEVSSLSALRAQHEPLFVLARSSDE